MRFFKHKQKSNIFPAKVLTVGADPNVLIPPREATLAMLNHAQGQQAIWETEVARLQQHLANIDAFGADTGPIPLIVPRSESA